MSSNKDDDQATGSLVGSKVRVQKIAAAGNPAFKTPSWEEHVPGAPNEGESLPSGYTVTGTLKSYVEEGSLLVVLRDTRNGKEVGGVMQTSEIHSVEEKQGSLIAETQNSIYRVFPIEQSDFASGPEGLREAEHFLFLDDTRDPEYVYPDTPEKWDHVTGPEGFKEYVLHAPQKRLVISFDHDLGAEETGMDLAKWMARQGIKPAEWKVHSANVSGAENMRRFLNGWMKHGERGEPWDPEQAMQNLADQSQELGIYENPE